MHRIRRQILELDLPREAGALALQRRAGRVFQEQVLPRLDEVFSRLAPADRVLRIDRLELDLGEILEANWEREFVEKCVAQISRQVTEMTEAAGNASSVDRLSPEENALAIFQYFLETGRLPWHSKSLTLSDLAALTTHAFAQKRGIQSAQIRRMLKEEPAVLQRLVWQFSPAFVENILEAVLGLESGWIGHFWAMRQKQPGQKTDAPSRMHFFKQLISQDQAALPKSLPDTVWVEKWLEQEAHISGDWAHTKTDTKLENPAKPQSPGQADEAILSAPAKPSEPEKPAKNDRLSTQKPDSEGIWVDNAGLVLLAFYLPPFFKKLGLELLAHSKTQETALDAGVQNPQFRAIHLLHYLATGQENPEEQQLVLPKILCGLPLESPVPQQFSLSPEDQQESRKLLEAVIRNWPVLKNTSPEGLRASFLCRSGLLSWSEGRQSWVLQVERLGQDMLLDRLPWSFSVVKLGWMEAILGVEW